MNKKIFISLIVIFILIGSFYFWKINQKDSHGCLTNRGYFWCDIENSCTKDKGKDCSLTVERILEEAKKIIGFDLNVMPSQVVKWKTQEKDTAFLGKGVYYLDLLHAEKINLTFEGWDSFLKNIGFKEDSLNPSSISEERTTLKYQKDKILCQLEKFDNPNQTSSILLICSNTGEELCNFNSDCGRSCQTDTDCGLMVNGCDRKSVCRNRSFKFYNDCDNPTSTVEDLDTRIGSCLCIENQCVPEKEELRDMN